MDTSTVIVKPYNACLKQILLLLFFFFRKANEPLLRSSYREAERVCVDVFNERASDFVCGHTLFFPSL